VQTASELRADLKRFGRQSESGHPQAPMSAPSRRRGWLYAAAGAVVLAAAAAGWLWMRSAGQLAARADWVQLTHFPDSVVQPTLSQDGRMITFIRGPSSLTTSGQVYVKFLPDGGPKQITRDDLLKMSPVFSPDGSQIAYTALDAHNNYDTWVVPVLGGEPRQWLPNASGLVWSDRKHVLFSEIIDKHQGNHMKIVTAEESRAGARDVYVPMPRGAMAHRSYVSPGGKWALVVEMSDRGPFRPCQLVPMDGKSPGRAVGPPDAECWFAAWSPDGKWMYLNSSAGGGFHIWRERFSETGARGGLEQITSGPTEEEGIAMAPDGRSFITAVGLKQSAIWVHDSKGDRQVSLEGAASRAKFTPDGKALLCTVVKNASDYGSELWYAELDTGRTEPLLPNFPIATYLFNKAYDLSPDGRQVVLASPDREGKPRLWLAPIDRRLPPRQIPNVEGDGPMFGPGGEIFFRSREGTYGFAYRVREDGSGLRKAIEHPVIYMDDVSPDGQWLAVYTRPSEDQSAAIVALPLGGGPPVRLFSPGIGKWSPDGKLLLLSPKCGNTYVIPLPARRVLPEMPAGGFQDEREVLRLPGVRVIDSLDVAPGPTPDIYAFMRETVQRNLYRIPVR